MILQILKNMLINIKLIKIMKCQTCMEFSTSEQVYHKSHKQEKLQVVQLKWLSYKPIQFFSVEGFCFEALSIQYKNLSF